MALHVQNVASVPELVDPLGQSTHSLLLTYWDPAVHDAAASRQTFSFSLSPGTTEPVLTLFSGQSLHSLFLAYLFAAHVHVVAEPPSLVEPPGQSVHAPSLMYWFTKHVGVKSAMISPSHR